MTATVVSVERLVKRYGSFEAVSGIEFDVRAGEVFGFLGPNGAGKSTTIRCLMGLLRPTAGRIAAFGLDTWRDGVAARRRIAYLPGELRLPDKTTTLDLVASVARLRGGIDLARRDAIAERLSLDMKRPLRDLSSGNRRKVALLLAFASTADLLVLDEPTNGLDPLMQHEFLGLVREARTEGRTVLLSSHVLSEVQRVADRVAVLRAGRLIAIGTVPELRGRARQRVEVWFDGEVPAAALAALDGIANPAFDGRRFAAHLAGPVAPLLDLLARHPVASMLLEDPDLDDAFIDLYAAHDAAEAGGTPAAPAAPASPAVAS